MERHAKLPRLTLVRSFYGFVALASLGLIGAGLILFGNIYESTVNAALDRAVRVRTVAAGQMIGRVLHQDWNTLGFIAGELGKGDAREAAALMAGMRGDGERISWIGHADATGTVLTASGGLLEGADVSARPWFRNGLRGSFAGDVHEAVLLASLLPGADGEPRRFLDLALPVSEGSGDVTGVVGVHIDAAWVSRVLGEIAAALEIDLFLVNPEGRVVLSSTGETFEGADLDVLRTARVGAASAALETWPDGTEYFTTLVPSVAYRDLPDFGWRLVGRIGPETFRLGLDGVRSTGGIVLAALLSLLFALAAGYVMAFLRPIERLAANADRIASGQDDYPEETRTTREGTLISASLARLQNRSIRSTRG